MLQVVHLAAHVLDLLSHFGFHVGDFVEESVVTFAPVLVIVPLLPILVRSHVVQLGILGNCLHGVALERRSGTLHGGEGFAGWVRVGHVLTVRGVRTAWRQFAVKVVMHFLHEAEFRARVQQASSFHFFVNVMGSHAMDRRKFPHRYLKM